MMPDITTLKELIAKYDEHKATEPELHKRTGRRKERINAF